MAVVAVTTVAAAAEVVVFAVVVSMTVPFAERGRFGPFCNHPT
ncbi:hypothetical protein [Streptomonospora mangrovi]|nr:hypothetical protein [Streptomonospora mangrovi]